MFLFNLFFVISCFSGVQGGEAPLWIIYCDKDKSFLLLKEPLIFLQKVSSLSNNTLKNCMDYQSLEFLTIPNSEPIYPLMIGPIIMWDSLVTGINMISISPNNICKHIKNL